MSNNKQTFTIGWMSNDKLYKVNTAESVTIASSTTPDMNVWHCRYWHMNSTSIERLAKNGVVTGMGLDLANADFDMNCEGCALRKKSRYPFPKKSQSKLTRPLELIHSNICGPMTVDSIGGSKYMLTFTDDFTDYVTVFFIKSKAQVLSKCSKYLSTMENKTGSLVESSRVVQDDQVGAQRVGSDNGVEYMSHEFARFC